MSKINPAWCDRMNDKLRRQEAIDETITYATAAKWLVAALARRSVPFAIHKLGLGVSRITTETTKCPCCNKPL